MTDATHISDRDTSAEAAYEVVMSPAEEQTAALRVATLRRLFWRAILGHAPFLAAICGLAEEVLPPATCPREAIAAALASGRDEALAALADRLGRVDAAGALSDRILADLASIELGLGSLCLRVRAAEPGPEFFRWATAVRRHHHALVVVRQALVRANQRLVLAIARRHVDGVMSLRDLVHAGNVGLLRAIDRFDAGRGLPFATCAAWWIRRAIARALAERSRRGAPGRRDLQ